MIAAAVRPNLDGRGVETGVGLGDGEACLVLARDQRRQHALLLLAVAESDHRLKAENVDVNGGSSAHGGAGLGDRLHHDRSLGDAEIGAAVLLRHGNAEPTGFSQRRMQLVWELAAPVLFEPVAIVERGTELEDRFPDLLLLQAQ